MILFSGKINDLNKELQKELKKNKDITVQTYITLKKTQMHEKLCKKILGEFYEKN